MSRVGVFAFPAELDFYLAARHTHKQLLTLYNPYDFAVNFNVLSTSPHKFTVIEPEGAIAPLSCVDVIVRYSQPSTAHCHGQDKFRIVMRDRATDANLGKRDIPVKFYAGEPEDGAAEGGSTDDSFQPAAKGDASGAARRGDLPIVCNHPAHRDVAPNVIAICVGLASIAALLLPTRQEPPTDTSVPPSLHLSVNLKLVFSFVLGLVSMVILKP